MRYNRSWIGGENVRVKKVAKLILGAFIISALLNGFNISINSENPPIRAQGTYIDYCLV